MVALIAVIALVVGATGCPRGSENLVPTTRRGWGVAFILVGGAWIVAGGVTAADDESSVGQRAGLGLAFGALGVGLIALGWTLGRFGDKPAQQPASTNAPPPPPPPPSEPSGPPGG